MITKAYILAAVTTGVVKAQATDYYFIASGLTGTFCDGSSMVSLKSGPDNHEWVQEEEMSLSTLLRRNCEDIGGGGVQHQGGFCVIEERSRKAQQIKEEANESEPVRTRAKDLVSQRPNPLERRQLSCDSDEACYAYSETTFAGNIHGISKDVCNNQVSQNGQSCVLTTTVTVTDSYDVGVNAGLQGVIDVGASFTVSHSEAYTETLTVDIPINCPDGAQEGRVFWYPYTQVPRGECTKADCIDGVCQNIERFSCTTSKAVGQLANFPSGVYEADCF